MVVKQLLYGSQTKGRGGIEGVEEALSLHRVIHLRYRHLQRDWCFLAEQPAHLAHSEGRAALRIVRHLHPEREIRRYRSKARETDDLILVEQLLLG